MIKVWYSIGVTALAHRNCVFSWGIQGEILNLMDKISIAFRLQISCIAVTMLHQIIAY